MIHKEKQLEGNPKEKKKKSTSGVTEVLRKRLSKTLKSSLYSHAAFCTTTHTYTHAQTHKESCGRSYENYYFHIVDDRVENHLKTL